MTQYINKDALETEIDKLDNQDFSVIDDLSGRTAYFRAIEDFYRILDNIKVKEIEENNQSGCSQDESKYHCGPEPRFKVGDVVFCLESYADYKDEYEYGIVTKVELDKDDWVYTFDYYGLSTVRSESDLVSDEAYTK